MNPSTPQSSGPDNPFNRLEDELNEIEMAEILQDKTEDVLAEKGFIGDKPVAIERTKHVETTEKEKLRFEPGMEYERFPEKTKLEEITLESLRHLKEIPKGTLIATRKKDDKSHFSKGMNVSMEIAEGQERYVADIKGKAFIHNNKLHLLPADADAHFNLKISPDGMTAWIDCWPAYGSGKPLDLDIIHAALEQNKIHHGILYAALKKIVETANASQQPIQDAVIASGTPSLKGEDGRIDFAFNIAEQKQDFKILPDGRIDYRSCMNIITAKPGQQLAKAVAPKEGRPGSTILGTPLKADPGKPAILVAGQGVLQQEDNYTAAIEGHVMLNGNVLEVLQVYIVNGDVDFSTGNVSFNGNVVITGSVMEGFEVKADGDITINKSIDPCRLEAGRDIQIKGGVQGRGKGILIAGRDISVEYVQNARLEAQGNIQIRNFAVNSTLYTSKKLSITEMRGMIVGGETFAQQGLEAKCLGSSAGTKTYIEVGTDFLVGRKIQEMEQTAAFCRNNLAKIENALRPVAELLLSANAVQGDARNAILKKTLEKKKQLETHEKTIQAKLDHLKTQLIQTHPCSIKVLDTCFPDVIIRIKGQNMVFQAERERIIIQENPTTGEIMVSPLIK